MTQLFNEDQVLVQITRLTRSRLTAFIDAEAVRPAETEAGPQFGAADLARLDLLCELEDLYEMTPDALAVVIAVIDQMHAARHDRQRLLAAVAAEAVEVQLRIAAALARPQEPTDG